MSKSAMIVAAGLLGICGAASAEVVTRVALLTGSQEVPPNASAGRGGARFVIDTDANTATFEIVYWGLGSAETAAHIHGTSAPGANSGVVFALPAGPVKRGTWNYPEAAQAALLNGLMYINVHTAGFPGGEVRGQIVSAVADLDGGQEVPANGSAGAGVGLFNIDPALDQMSYYIIYGGLGSPESAAHIHGYARHGVNAGVVHGLPAGNPKTGVWNYPAAQEQAILDGMTYVNIHTTGIPGGEIRGQIVTWLNTLCGLQEVPPNPSNSTGVSLAAIDRAANTLTTDTRYSGFGTAETAAHIHGFADVGVNAGVLTALPAGLRKLNSWGYGAASFNNVFTSRTYINIHSTAFAGGEIRGQLFRGTSVPCTPLVTDQPDGVTVTAPTPVSMTVVADARGGGTLSYQWKRNGVNLPAAAPFSGTTGPTLTISPTAPILSGNYTCEVTNLCGVTLSDVATLVVEEPCDGDVNCDFALDGFDVEAQEKAVGGDTTDYCQPDPDFNGDFALDGFDVEAVETVVGGGPCP